MTFSDWFKSVEGYTWAACQQALTAEDKEKAKVAWEAGFAEAKFKESTTWDNGFAAGRTSMARELKQQTNKES